MTLARCLCKADCVLLLAFSLSRGNQGAEGFSPAFCADGVGPGLRVRFVSTARARGARGMADSILEVWGDGLSQQQCNTHTQLLSTSVVWAVQGL